MAHKGRIVMTGEDGTKVIDCEECGFIHQHPLPSKRELDTFYRKKYFKTPQSKDYCEKKISESTYIDFCNSEKERKIRKCLTKNLPLNMLDIGCGSGDLITLFKEKGWDVIGIEPSKNLYDRLLRRSNLNIFSALSMNS